jgi:hypothetical protein
MVALVKKGMLRKPGATNSLAESMPYLPIENQACALPFEEVLYLLVGLEHAKSEEDKLRTLQVAMGIADAIFTHPSFITSLYT